MPDLLIDEVPLSHKKLFEKKRDELGMTDSEFMEFLLVNFQAKNPELFKKVKRSENSLVLADTPPTVTTVMSVTTVKTDKTDITDIDTLSSCLFSGKKIKITINSMPSDVWKKIKRAAIESGCPIGDFVGRCFIVAIERDAELRKSLEQVGLTVNINKNIKEPPKVFKVRNAEADLLLSKTRAMIKSKEITPKALAFRCDQLLRPFLSSSDVPDDQKSEIAAFINEVTTGKVIV